MMIVIPLLLAVTAPSTPAPSPDRLEDSVRALVGFGTRHTMSSATDPKRGIGAARDWAAARFRDMAKRCDECITVERIDRLFTGPRAPNGVRVEDVLGVQKGRDPTRAIIVGGHIDSRVTDVLNATADAPGANDDASGVALVLEAAQILSKQKFDATIIYAVFSGEEQGLWGSTLLADTAKARGWQVSAMLNNDIVGNTVGQGGTRENRYVRVFSEGIRSSETLPEQMERRAIGGEDDGPSRALAKAVAGTARSIPAGLDVFIDRRPDRFGRGGDHEPFSAARLPGGTVFRRQRKLGRPASGFEDGARRRLRRYRRPDGLRLSCESDRDQCRDDRATGLGPRCARGSLYLGRAFA